MKRPALITGIAFAFVVAILAVPLWWGLQTILPFDWVFRVALVIPYLAYVLYLILAARSRVGGITLSAVNLVIGAALIGLPLGKSLLVFTLAGLTTVNRSLLFHLPTTGLPPEWHASGQCSPSNCRMTNSAGAISHRQAPDRRCEVQGSRLGLCRNLASLL